MVEQIWLSARRSYTSLVIETPALWSGMDRLIKTLDRSGQSLDRHLRGVKGRTINQQTLAHIINIERWAQRRLCVALGEPLCEDPGENNLPIFPGWIQLVEDFHTARKETISLGKSLRMAGINPKTKIPHHQLGDLSILGWLYYINIQANLESIRIQ